jgi:hypothetical protein
MKQKLTKEEFLRRCAIAYDIGYFDCWSLLRARNTLDLVMRLKASFVAITKSGYGNDVEVYLKLAGYHAGLAKSLIEDEVAITPRILANDTEAYQAIELFSLLAHPCQICAEDKDAWHTRYGFCPHKDTKLPKKRNAK